MGQHLRHPLSSHTQQVFNDLLLYPQHTPSVPLFSPLLLVLTSFPHTPLSGPSDSNPQPWWLPPLSPVHHNHPELRHVGRALTVSWDSTSKPCVWTSARSPGKQAP